jgi:hypothetical protein
MIANLKAFYKEEIKARAQEIKERKPRIRAAQSLLGRGLGESEEYAKLASALPKCGWQGGLAWDRREMRALYLAYAVVRGRDLRAVEKDPPPAAFYERTLASMQKRFAESAQAAANG